MKTEIYDIDDILISQRVYDAWLDYAPIAVQDIIILFAKNNWQIKKSDIKDEQFRVYEDGRGEIFVSLPHHKEIKMKVPPNEWAFKETKSSS